MQRVRRVAFFYAGDVYLLPLLGDFGTVSGKGFPS
jgi:hypothetical protein